MSQEFGKQGSFFDEEETRAREFDAFRKRMEKAFGVQFDQIDPQEMYRFIHEVNEDERSQEEEEKRLKREEELRKLTAKNIKEINDILNNLDNK